MSGFESGRRLCLLVEAGRSRFALEATSVAEVAAPGGDGETLRGVHPLIDLSRLLGGEAEERPGIAVVIDVSPTLALRVKRVVEVADVARAEFFQLPQGLGEGLTLTSRGALMHQERLYLELTPEALPHQPGQVGGAPARSIYLAESPPDRALIFESEGRRYGVPLPLVSQVVPLGETFCPLPSPKGPWAGLLPHAKALFLVCTPAGLLGGLARALPLVVLTELAGQNVAVGAERVLGVHGPFREAETRGEFISQSLDAPALFLDLQRMFS